jgi:hypothetical protein|tara:strand:- start:1096 stop:1287 length:192 start_codon:yes stop_codon:yes gene_type:complete
MFKEFNKLQMAYTVLFFYAVLTMITATVGYKMNTKNGFTHGYIVGSILSVALWFQIGKKYSKL